jgi:hypothetical protein
MKTVSRTVPGILTSIATFGFLALANAGDKAEDHIKKSFHVTSGGQLILETDRGAIEVRTAETNTRPEVEVTAETNTRLEVEVKEAAGLSVEFTLNGKDVHIRGKNRRSFWRWLWWVDNWQGPQFLIAVPAKYNVDLHTSGGSISVDDLEGEVRSKTAGGSLHFGRIRGPVRGETSGGSIALAGCVHTAEVKTSGGDVSIGEVDGDVIAQTSGGSIHIARATGRVVAETSGGSIEVEEVRGAVEATASGGSVTARISRQPQGDSRLETSGGNVAVFLADTVGVEVDARTSGGRVTTELPVTVQGELSETALQAKINNGGPKLILRTSGGNIRLGKMS